jgi:hypothetical protein
MIIKDTITPKEHGEREVIVTDDTAQHWARYFGAESLGDLDERSVREIYDAIKHHSDQQNHPIKTRYRNDAGEIELDPAELGDDLFQAMRPEAPNDAMFDPQYSEVEFTVKVMGRTASDAYNKMIEARFEDSETRRLEDIASGASVALHTVLQPPNLAT